MSRTDALKWLKGISYIGIFGGLLMPLMFVPVVIFPFVFSKLLFFQILIGLTFPAYVVLAWFDPKSRPRSSLLFTAIASYFVAIFLSTLFSVDPWRSWWGNQERMNGLFTLLHFFAWLVMMIGLLKNWVDWRRLLNFQVVLSVFMAIVAILQKPFPKLLSFPASDRPGGLLDNPIYMGVYQIFNLFFILLLWLKGPTTKQLKWWYAIAAAIDVTAFVLAQSRGSLVGLAAGVIVFAIAYAIMTPNKKAKRLVLGVAALLFALYGVLFSLRSTSFVHGTPLDRFTSFSGGTNTRFIAWDIAWKGFIERPLFGWGFDAFHILFNQKYNPDSLHFGYYETWFDRSHNTVLDILSMTGLVGFITFVGMVVSLYYLVIRSYRRKWNDVYITSVLLALPTAYFVQNLFVFDHPAAFSMSFLMYALVIVGTTATFAGKSDEDISVRAGGASSHTAWTVFVVLEIAAILLVWRTSWMPAQASIWSIRSNQAFAQGLFDDAYAYAQKAAAIATPYLDEQTFLQARNLISYVEAGGDVKRLTHLKEWHALVLGLNERHLKDHGANTHPHFILARFAQTMMSLFPEDVQLAEREYLKSIELSPKRQQLYFSYGRLLIDIGRKDQGIEQFRKVLAFDPELGEAHWLLGMNLAIQQNKAAEGSAEMVLSQTVKYPYGFQDAREIQIIGHAYEFTKNVEGMKKLMDVLPKLPRANLDVYIEIAKSFEHLGLLQQRNMIVGALMQIDQQAAVRFAPLVSGSATTIQAALDISAKNPVPVQGTSAVEIAPSSGSGPRR